MQIAIRSALLVVFCLQSNFLLADLETGRQVGKIIGKGKEKPVITLTHPRSGWTVNQMVRVAGTVNDPTLTPLIISINGDRYLVRITGNTFSRKFPVSMGRNSIVVQGTNAGGTTKVRKAVFAKTSPVAFSAILTSDTDGVYTDLHVYEPRANLKDPIEEGATKNFHVFWANTNSPSGGKFYLNSDAGSYDVPGFGPYLYTHNSPPKGIFRVDANYWPSGDKAHTVASLNLNLFEGTANEQKRMVQQPLVVPGETTTLAWVRIDENQKGYIYVPLLDPKPIDNKIWPEWVLKYKARQVGGGY
jgi:uncharacterized protein YfaP (DUF2135 family)